MKLSAIHGRAPAPAELVADLRAGPGIYPWTVRLAALAAIAIQSLLVPIDADVSWLITVCERVLSGDRLYVDILEVNPPASVWLYLPLVWLAKIAGIKAEAAVAGAFVAGGIASVIATLRLTARFDGIERPGLLAAALAFATLVLPMALFAQREHAALLLALPSLAAVACIAEGKVLGRKVLAATGVAAGLVIVIKPYFLPAMLLPSIWAAWKRRSLRPFAPAVAAAVAVVLLYAAAVLLLAPAYFHWIPIIARTYAPMHELLWKLLIGPALFPAISIALAAILRPRRVPPLSWAFGLGAAGFLLAAILQAKNYPNHWLPQAALALVAAASVAASTGVEIQRRRAVAAALGLVGFFEMYEWTIRPDPAVAKAIEAVAPPSPTMIALSPQLTTGHPVTRNVGGHWVGSSAGLFTASGARYVGLKDDYLRQVYRDDIDSFVADVGKSHPDVILVSIPAKRWLMGEPAIARSMAGYRRAAGTAETEVWVPRSPAP